MLKKTITYTDFNDVSHTEDFYFNISKSELAQLQLSAEGGLDKKIEKIVKEKNIAEAMEMFHYLISKSYGVKSDDGKRFVKSEELSLEFTQSLAYNQLFDDILSTENSAVEFMLGILPKDVADAIRNSQK